MNDMKSKLKGMTLLSLLSLGGCVSMEKAPPVPTLTLAELRTEINLSEQRLQTSMEQQQKQYVQQQHLLVQLNTDVNNMKESVKKVDSKLESLPPEPPKPMAIPTEKCQAPSQGHTVDGKLLVGEAEWIWVDAANDAFQARVDTGATTSSTEPGETTTAAPQRSASSRSGPAKARPPPPTFMTMRAWRREALPSWIT